MTIPNLVWCSNDWTRTSGETGLLGSEREECWTPQNTENGVNKYKCFRGGKTKTLSEPQKKEVYKYPPITKCIG